MAEAINVISNGKTKKGNDVSVCLKTHRLVGSNFQKRVVAVTSKSISFYLSNEEAFSLAQKLLASCEDSFEDTTSEVEIFDLDVIDHIAHLVVGDKYVSFDDADRLADNLTEGFEKMHLVVTVNGFFYVVRTTSKEILDGKFGKYIMKMTKVR
jgi:hypothetical protein